MMSTGLALDLFKLVISWCCILQHTVDHTDRTGRHPVTADLKIEEIRMVELHV